jgi:hypothetical protein
MTSPKHALTLRAGNPEKTNNLSLAPARLK